MRDCPFALFDLDGTLVDSMYFWQIVPLEFAERMIGKLTEEDILRLRKVNTYLDIYLFLAERGIEITMPELMRLGEEGMRPHYEHDVREKPGVRAFLEELKKKGTRMGVITLTLRENAECVLKATGLDTYFDFVITPSDMPDGSGKESNAIYFAALDRFGAGAKPEDTLFFEDSYYSAKRAGELGFHAIGVKDIYSADSPEKLASVTEEMLDFGQNERGVHK